jgi:hypothetical protein
VVNAEIAVPPMPMPKIPSAVPRRAGGYQALTSGTPIANVVPPRPRKNPPISSAAKLSATRPTNSTGSTVSRLTTGNMTRAPIRSVSAPTGMRPSDPTTTGTATSTDCWNPVRSSWSRYAAPSGLMSAHAQKLTPNPMVASASIRPAPSPVPCAGVTARVTGSAPARRAATVGPL